MHTPQLRKLCSALTFCFEALRKLGCSLNSLNLLHFNCAALSKFFQLITQCYKFNLVLFHVHRNINKLLFTIYMSKIAKNGRFTLC